MTAKRRPRCSARGAPSLFLLWSIAAAALGCASAGAPSVTPAGPASAFESSPDSDVTSQALLRVRYRGKDGRGKIRLTVRSAADGRFSLAASDTFGRRLWSYARDGESSLFLDHREKSYCRLTGELVLRAVALADLPVGSLPGVLAGELPSAAKGAVPDDGTIEFRGVDGRDWRARFEAGRPVTWALLEDGKPQVWWQGSAEAGVLSHRDGAQASWTLSAREQLPGGLEDLPIPAGYTEEACDVDDPA